MDALTAHERVAAHMRTYYRREMDTLEITETRGYWRSKEFCDPATCRSPAVHGCYGWEDGIKHTYFYAEWGARDPDGKFASPYRAWRALYLATHGDEIQAIENAKMAFGCPVCGGFWDHLEREVIPSPNEGEARRGRHLPPVVLESPTFAFCRNGHRFIVEYK